MQYLPKRSLQLTRQRSILIAIILVVMSAAVVLSMTLGLRATILMIHWDMGIPGISKVYGAKLTNRGLLPFRTSQCDFVDEVDSETTLPYAVQRWDETGKKWETLVEEAPSEFCKVFPLGIVRGKIVERWLWPRQSIVIRGEAAAARGGFSLGDRARFVIFLRTAGDYRHSVPTDEFVIDEQIQNATGLRVKH